MSMLLRCGSATATTLAVSWDAVADLYYMALAAHKCGAQHHVLDLVPNQTYHVTLPPG